MIIFKKIPAFEDQLRKLQQSGPIGFVPTMGALHRGHLELIRTASRENKNTVVSIFVNPAQFNDPKDFLKYPVTLEKDIELLAREDCDILFLPGLEEIYPQGYTQAEYYDLGRLDEVLEGKFRPGHFQGVCRVVNRLLELVQPDNLYIGRKDYQQCLVISRLVKMKGWKTRVIICDTVREFDGLAMSSRNLRLTPGEREKAPVLFALLQYCRDHIQPGNLDGLKKYVHEQLLKNGIKKDYFEFARADSLETIESWDGVEPMVALIAVFIYEVRLIDNLIISA